MMQMQRILYERALRAPVPRHGQKIYTDPVDNVLLGYIHSVTIGFS